MTRISTVRQASEFTVAYTAEGTLVQDETGGDIQDIEVTSVTIGGVYMDYNEALAMDHTFLVNRLFQAAYEEAMTGDFE